MDRQSLILVCLYVNERPRSGINTFVGVSFSVRCAHGKHPHAVAIHTRHTLGEIDMMAIEADVQARIGLNAPTEFQRAKFR